MAMKEEPAMGSDGRSISWLAVRVALRGRAREARIQAGPWGRHAWGKAASGATNALWFALLLSLLLSSFAVVAAQGLFAASFFTGADLAQGGPLQAGCAAVAMAACCFGVWTWMRRDGDEEGLSSIFAMGIALPAAGIAFWAVWGWGLDRWSPGLALGSAWALGAPGLATLGWSLAREGKGDLGFSQWLSARLRSVPATGDEGLRMHWRARALAEVLAILPACVLALGLDALAWTRAGMGQLRSGVRGLEERGVASQDWPSVEGAELSKVASEGTPKAEVKRL